MLNEVNFSTTKIKQTSIKKEKHMLSFEFLEEADNLGQTKFI